MALVPTDRDLTFMDGVYAKVFYACAKVELKKLTLNKLPVAISA